MTAPASSTQWYLAREGQQYGPLSDAELARFIELGHMLPSDLLWREGFPDWRPAMVVFPPQTTMRTAPHGRPVRHREQTDPVLAGAGLRTAERGREASGQKPRGGGSRRLLLGVLVLAILGGAGWLAYPHRTKIIEYANSMVALAPSNMLEPVDRKSLEAPPLAGFTDAPDAVDLKLQATAVWRVIKREFPEWYAERLKEAAALAAENKDDTVIGQQMARALVSLRRRQVEHALSASLPRLKLIASTFFDNLVQLRKHSTDACYGFISQGEANPAIVALLQGSQHTAHLQAQMTAVFEAIAEGRKSPRVYPKPRKTDYDLLASDLTKRGWTQADMRLFSNERALAQAEPAKVCQMVHDWFAAQLAITDQDTQLRLLVDSLRPVVAG
jgi:hypothetical protein